ncbi:MAG: TetR/AcrR family transcriptional regulator [Proteobacteria bacterium]|nr:TetR/AcrR family transcriptional regulator [Pseudomonadota bacterium]
MTNSRPAPTRDRILAAAERLFAAQGFSGVSMPAIAAASGITAGAIYKHFESKAELFFEVVRRAVTATPAAPQGLVSLPEMVANYTAKRMKAVRQLAIEAHYAAAKDATVEAILKRALDAQKADIRAVIAAGQRMGALDPSLDATLLAEMVFVMILGLTHAETLAPQRVGDADWRDFVRDRVAAMLGTTVLGAGVLGAAAVTPAAG